MQTSALINPRISSFCCSEGARGKRLSQVLKLSIHDTMEVLQDTWGFLPWAFVTITCGSSTGIPTRHLWKGAWGEAIDKHSADWFKALARMNHTLPRGDGGMVVFPQPPSSFKHKISKRKGPSHLGHQSLSHTYRCGSRPYFHPHTECYAIPKGIAQGITSRALCSAMLCLAIPPFMTAGAFTKCPRLMTRVGTL